MCCKILIYIVSNHEFLMNFLIYLLDVNRFIKKIYNE